MNTGSFTQPVEVLVERTNEIKRAWMTEIPGVVMVLFAAPTHEGGENE